MPRQQLSEHLVQEDKVNADAMKVEDVGSVDEKDDGKVE